jgi:hypothetical protein
VSQTSELEEDEEWPEERDLRETKRWRRSLIVILAVSLEAFCMNSQEVY